MRVPRCALEDLDRADVCPAVIHSGPRILSLLALVFGLFLSLIAPQACSQDFQPDEPITSIKVKVHTGDVSEGGTDDDVYIRLFGGSRTEIDTANYNDFERNDTDNYNLRHSYFDGSIVNDIDRVCVEKSSDGIYGGWALGYVTVTVNGKILYSSLNPDSPNFYRWLEDDHRTWCAGNFKRIDFVDPKIETLGFWDAEPNKKYEMPLHAVGGRKPLTWKIASQNGTAFTGPAVLKPVPGNTTGTDVILSAQTVNTSSVEDWGAVIRVTDADGRTGELSSSMRVIFALPAPTVTSFDPKFGWPKTAPTVPNAVKVKVKGTNFDSRPPQGRTKVFFNGVEGKVLQITDVTLEAEVPKGAAPGKIKVKTEFGEAFSNDNFVAHQYGYRQRSGMSWVNSANNLPDSYAWERYEQTFGICDMWICIAGHGTIPDPVATLFYLISKGSVSEGVCHGMSLTSLQMKKGILPQANYASQEILYPLDGSIFDLVGPGGPSSGLSKTVQSRQLVVWSDEGLSYFLDKIDDIPNASGLLCTMDARTALNDLKGTFNNNSGDPRMIAFSKNCSPFAGHVVVPYVVEPKENVAGIDFEKIRAWNPNFPAELINATDPNAMFNVRSNSGEWSFEWGDGSVWDGIYMFTVPLSAYGHQEDWSLPGLGVLSSTVSLFLPGFASAVGGGTITQVEDKDGHQLFRRDGTPQPDPALRAQGVNVAPQFVPGGESQGGLGPKMITLKGTDPVTFTLSAPSTSPTAPPSDPTLFSIFNNQQMSASVEDVRAPLSVKFDPANHGIQVSPLEGTASPILRFSARFPDTSESFSYAVRLHDVASAKPVTFTPASGGRAFMLKANDAALTVDLEVAHTDRHGQQKVLESDAINVPPNALATVGVGTPDTLDQTGAKPINLKLETVGGATETTLGENLTGITLKTPTHSIGPPPGVAVFPVVVDASKSKTAFQLPITYKSQYGPKISTQQDGKLAFPIAPGTQVVQIIGEDSAGHRSFPRTVLLTIPDASEKTLSPLTVFGDDTSINPGDTGMVPLGAYLTDYFPTDHISIDLSSRLRLSGKGSQYPIFKDTGFELSPELEAMGGTAVLTAGTDGISAHLEIGWDSTKPLTGKIALGKLPIQIPADTLFGNTFLIKGSAKATSGPVGASQPKSDMNVLPTMIRVWGGPEPATLAITGPIQVAEEADAMFQADSALPAVQNAGWWSEGLGGRVQLIQDPNDLSKVKVTGQKAGYVKLHSIVGTKTAEMLVKVTPTVKSDPIGLSVGRAPIIQFPLPRIKGDLDGDGLILVQDAVLDLRFIVGLEEPTAELAIPADANGDGDINVGDVIKILRVIVGLETI